MKCLKCKHPFASLGVKSPQIELEPMGGDFELVTLHLFCRKCGEEITVKFARCTGGTADFLTQRGVVLMASRNGQ